MCERERERETRSILAWICVLVCKQCTVKVCAPTFVVYMMRHTLIRVSVLLTLLHYNIIHRDTSLLRTPSGWAGPYVLCPYFNSDF